ncbi:hypothetical protein Elgi_73980 [Paenibacillus elgii]|uniref:hypothetical protein n=1 Tax=Paenibacillus elgii TaxID=189691 RepID=UPI002D7D5E7D|nr:hypothetical protein Elgi_73980 [Paenibacillus elgii]
MKNRSKNYIRHQRERMIRKKWDILKNVKMLPEYMPVRGALSKGKIHCSCRMCRYERERDHSIPKAKHKAKLKAMEQEIDE